MVTKSFLRSDIASRAASIDCPFELTLNAPKPLVGASTLWLSEVLSRLDAVGNDVAAVCSVFSNVSDIEKLAAVRSELSCIPVWYRLSTYTKVSENGVVMADVFAVWSLSRELIEVGSSRCPPGVVPRVNTSDYKGSRCVQCFYPVDLAKQLRLDSVKHWEVSDSIVDWLSDFSRTEGLRTSPRLIIEQVDADVCYKLSWSGRSLTDIDAGDRLDRLYAYIVKNAPVSTADMVMEGIASRRQTFNLIRVLENTNQIERVAHGVYIAL